MMDSDNHFEETLNAQFKTVYDWSMTSRCNPIPCFNMPCMYGDTSIANEPVGNFQGQTKGSNGRAAATWVNQSRHGIDARDVKLELLKSRAAKSNDASDWELLKSEEALRKDVDLFFAGLAETVCEAEG